MNGVSFKAETTVTHPAVERSQKGLQVVCKIAAVLLYFRVVQQDVKHMVLFAFGCQARLDHALKETS